MNLPPDINKLILGYLVETYRPVHWMPQTKEYLDEFSRCSSAKNPRAISYIRSQYRKCLNNETKLDLFIKSISQNPSDIALKIISAHLDKADPNRLGDNPNEQAQELLHEYARRFNYQLRGKAVRSKSPGNVSGFNEFCSSLPITPENQIKKMEKFSSVVKTDQHIWGGLCWNSDPIVIDILENNLSKVRFDLDFVHHLFGTSLNILAYGNNYLWVPYINNKLITLIEKNGIIDQKI